MTNRGLREVRAGALRQDLFYRLSVIVIEVPALRERQEDIPSLFEYFLARYRHRGAARLWNVEPEALDQLLCYPFPGNVRELENLAQFLCTMLPAQEETARAQDVAGWLRQQHVGDAVSDVPGQGSLKLCDVEEWAIRTAVERAGGNKSRAAAMLGISRSRFDRRLQKIAAIAQRGAGEAHPAGCSLRSVLPSRPRIRRPATNPRLTRVAGAALYLLETSRNLRGIRAG